MENVSAEMLTEIINTYLVSENFSSFKNEER